jgi:DNA-binding MarR family transcriptional regulator
MNAATEPGLTDCTEDVHVPDELLGTVIELTRVVAAVIVSSVATSDPALTLPQWRVLVLASDENCNVSAVADDLGVHISNASRVCDRLVRLGLLERRKAEHDRRNVLLALTKSGEAYVSAAMEHRRTRVAAALACMTEQDRADFGRCATLFVDAAARARIEEG